jgi:Glyoxalase-like domain
MPVRLHDLVIDAHDLPGLARSRAQALGWRVVSGRENEIVVGTDENAPAGVCVMLVTDPKTVKNRAHPDPTISAAYRDQEINRLLALGAPGRDRADRRRVLDCPCRAARGRAKATAPGQLGGLGADLAGLRRRRIRNPGSLLSFS